MHWADAGGEPRRCARVGLRRAGCDPTSGEVHPELREHQDPARQPEPGGRSREDHGQGGPHLHGPGKRLRQRGGNAQGPGAREDLQGRLHRDPLRGPQGRPRHARDAHSHERHHGGWPWQVRRPDDRRTLLRRLPRVHHRPRLPGGLGRRSDRAAAERRHHHRRCREPPAQRRRPGGGVGQAESRVEAPAAASAVGVSAQVRKVGDVGEPRLFD
mmetsp:Transcript_107003/g.320032  ORF Transcript_107003/g.320032 Transcript_107003/m.320032 type:complete len:214 (+) Transcript_107003:169-810(+)